MKEIYNPVTGKKYRVEEQAPATRRVKGLWGYKKRKRKKEVKKMDVDLSALVGKRLLILERDEILGREDVKEVRVKERSPSGDYVLLEYFPGGWKRWFHVTEVTVIEVLGDIPKEPDNVGWKLQWSNTTGGWMPAGIFYPSGDDNGTSE